ERALAGAVVDDGNARTDAMHQRGGIRNAETVMRDHEQVDGSDRIVRAHQLEFLVPGEVAEMRDAELAERHDAADRLRVLGRVGLLLLAGRATRGRDAAA